ncbi:uncharacterized protein LOC124275775 [Haliotis rubra]|uniref:uncharacterized protein LOC124275775 n=1 Tax=Haliotis rubra TaxID=36100 RepID=UPI001EE50C15|nr:uncharacterized protein LOC124275775 [Haliotis rubra]
MKFAWRVPHITISLVVREVCETIIAEYLDELMVCPSTPSQWCQVADRYFQKWNFPHTCGAIDEKHVACHYPPRSGSIYYNYKGFLLFAMVDADYKFFWADIGSLGSASDAQVFNDSEIKESIEVGTIGFPDPEPPPNDI